MASVSTGTMVDGGQIGGQIGGQAATGAGPLAGRAIVVTRPALQAEDFAIAIRNAGGEPVLFPTIEIRDALDTAALERALSQLGDYDWAVFVSPNAVDKAFGYIKAWPGKVRAAAVGPGTKAALEQRGVRGVIMPAQQFDSEGVTELAEFANATGKRCIILRGNGGRELIGATLEARGAVVDRVECYRRAMPALDAGPLLARWAAGGVDAVTLTSSEGARNFVDLAGAGARGYFVETPVFVPHTRIAAAAQSLGFRQIIVTGSADAGLLAALSAHFGGSAGSLA